MAVEEVKAFFEKVEEDKSLQEKLKVLDQKANGALDEAIEELVKIAGTQGFAFTRQDFITFRNEQAKILGQLEQQVRADCKVLPNLLQEDLSQVWNKSYLREIVDIKKKDLLIKNPECAGCEFFKKCGGGCRALALIKTGNLMVKDMVTCDLWKKGYKKWFKELAIVANQAL
jgi:radical SAM protein with 4Fe4S-binding SPASM domain